MIVSLYWFASAAVPIIWAAHTSNSRSQPHQLQGSLMLNMQTGAQAQEAL